MLRFKVGELAITVSPGHPRNGMIVEVLRVGPFKRGEIARKNLPCRSDMDYVVLCLNREFAARDSDLRKLWDAGEPESITIYVEDEVTA